MPELVTPNLSYHHSCSIAVGVVLFRLLFALVNDSCCQDSPSHQDSDPKKPRRSERLSQKPDGGADKLKTPITKNQLPSPVTHLTDNDDNYKESTAEPPEGRPSQVTHRTPEETFSQAQRFSSPPQDTQAFPTQHVDPNAPLSDEVEDEVKEGVWGYLFPLDTINGGRPVVLRRRSLCPHKKDVASSIGTKEKIKGALQQEEEYEASKTKGAPSGGYLIGRHPECGKFIPSHGHGGDGRGSSGSCVQPI